LEFTDLNPRTKEEESKKNKLRRKALELKLEKMMK
jgi:hypothetical protein